MGHLQYILPKMQWLLCANPRILSHAVENLFDKLIFFWGREGQRGVFNDANLAILTLVPIRTSQNVDQTTARLSHYLQ